MSTLVSAKLYVVAVPTLGAWGTVSKVDVQRSYANVEEHQGEDNEFDAVILSGKRAEVSFDYTYISGETTTPETLWAAGAPVTLTDSTTTMLPGKLLITEVGVTQEKGKERTASCKGIWMPFMDTLS